MTLPFDSDAIFRARHVGGSEVSALFGCNPWLTGFELFHRKLGTIAVPQFNAISDDGSPENERIYWGTKLEAAIIAAAMERFGYQALELAAEGTALSNGRGLGGHPDARVMCPQRGPGLLEIKTADWLVRKGWGDEPPLHYLLQGTTYAGLGRVSWFDMLVLVGGNKLERFQYAFRPKLFSEIERRADAFWESVRTNTPPRPDYTRDKGVIAELYASADDGADGEVIELTGDNLAQAAAADYLIGLAEEKAGRLALPLCEAHAAWR